MADKQRLFVDMDGTLAVFTPVDELETLYEKGYFANLVPHENVVAAVQDIIKNHPEIEVHILSAYLTDSQFALQEKNEWLDKYLPEIDQAHRVFVPCGSDKKDGIDGGIRPDDFLLDDYTHNLNDWQPPARGIKLLNAINHTRGSWEHDRIRFDREPSALAEGIVSIMQGKERVFDERIKPMEQREKEFIENLAKFEYLRESENVDIFSAHRLLSDTTNWWLNPTNTADVIYDAERERLEKGNEETRFVVLTSEMVGYRNAPHDIVYNRALTEAELSLYRDNPTAFLEEMYAQLGNRGVQPSDYYGHSPSTGDAFVIVTPEAFECHYIDTIGFEQEQDVSRVMTEEQQRAARMGITVREELELLENINEFARSFGEDSVIDVVETETKGRLDFLHDEYTPVFNLAAIREVVEREQDKLGAIYDYEQENETAEPFVMGVYDGAYQISRDSVRAAMPDSRLVGDRYVYDDTRIIAGERLQAEVDRRFERATAALARTNPSFYRFEASPTPLGEQGQYDAFVQRYDRSRDGASAIPRDIVYIGEARQAAEVAQFLNVGNSSRYGADLLADIARRRENGEMPMQGKEADRDAVAEYLSRNDNTQPIGKGGITVDGHVGTWHIVDQTQRELPHRSGEQDAFYLLEHDTYGEDAAMLIVNKESKVVLDDVWNGFDDLDEAIDNFSYSLQELENAGYTVVQVTDTMGCELEDNDTLIRGFINYDDLSNNEMDLIISASNRVTRAMEAAGYKYSPDADSTMATPKYYYEGQTTPLRFESIKENMAWLDGVVFDDPEVSDAVEKIMHPSRFEETAEPNLVTVQAARQANYEGMVVLSQFDRNGKGEIEDKVFLGKTENYNGQGVYDNSDSSLIYLSDNLKMGSFLDSGEGWTESQQKMLENGAFSEADYAEYARLKEGALKQFEELHPKRFEIDIDGEKGNGVPFRYPDWNTPNRDVADLSAIRDVLNSDISYRYQFLDRLRSDCDYYLGYGNRNVNNLWAKNVAEQVSYMKAVWDSFSETEKPEWISYEDILRYEKEMAEPQKEIVVAIESTDDYADTNFHQNLVDSDVRNEDGSYGRTVDYYRLVTIGEDGRVKPYDTAVYDSAEAARKAVAQQPNLVLIGYDAMIDEAGKIMTQRGVEKMAEQNSHGANEKEAVLAERIVDFLEKYDPAFGYAEGLAGQENKEQWVDTIKSSVTDQSIYINLLELSKDNAEAREEAGAIIGMYAEISGYQPLPNRYYEPELDLDGTADELFTQARNGYIESPEALAKLQEILSNPVENKTEQAAYVGVLQEIAESEGEEYQVFAQMKKDILDGVQPEETSLRDGLSLEVRQEQDNVLIALTESGSDRDASGATVLPVEQFLSMSAQEISQTVDAVYAYNMVEAEREEEMERPFEKVTIDGHECNVVDKWIDGQDEYVLGNDIEDNSFYYAIVNSDISNVFEYDEQPTREKVEDDFLNLESQRDIDRHEAEFGADGSRVFPHLNDEPDSRAYESLAKRIDEFMYANDPYEYGDRVGTSAEERSAAREEIVGWLATKDNERLQGVVGTIEDIRDGFVDGDRVDGNNQYGKDIREANDLLYSLSHMEQYEQFFDRESPANAEVPVQEFRGADGRMIEGNQIPMVMSQTQGFSDRSIVFNAVQSFETDNRLPDNERVIHDGVAEDKEFVYGAYDKYVGMSHQNDLSIQPYMERINELTVGRQYQFASPLPMVAEVYYAQQNGLTETQIDYALEYVKDDKYPADTFRNVRRGLENGLSEEQLDVLKGESDMTQEYLLGYMAGGGSLEDAKALKGCDVAQYYMISDPLKKGKMSREMAQTIIQSVNGMMEKSYADYQVQREANPEAQISPRFNVFDSEFFTEYFVETSLADKTITPEQVAAVAKEFSEQTKTNNLREFVEQRGGFAAVSHGANEQERRTEMPVESAQDKETKRGLSLPEEKKDPKEKLTEQLQQGVKEVLNSENFKNWLDTSSKLFMNNYSFNNAMLVWLQRPDATHTMGYEQWKDYGRNVAQGAQGIKIFVPVIAYEKKDGELWRMIKSNLAAQMKNDPSLEQASYRIGMSKLEITMNQNGLYGLKVGGVEHGIRSEKDMQDFIKHNVIGKVPMYFSVGTVFDAKDTVVPEYLWVKKGYKKEELVKGEDGKPIKNRKGEYKIVNTPERQAKFTPSLDMSVPQKDPVKMTLLYDALKAVSERNGIPVYERERESDDTLKGGADGYYSRQFSDEHPKGFIVMPTDLDPTRKVSVMLHEMAHSELHGNLEKLAQQMGEDNIPRNWREIQAEAVAYTVGKQFGIDTDTSSFQYLAAYTSGFELQALSKSIEVIYKECQQISKELESELSLRGLNRDLSDRFNTPMEAEAVETIGKAYAEYAVTQTERIGQLEATLPALASQNAQNQAALAIVVEQTNNVERQKEDVGVICSALEVMQKADTLDGQKEAIAKIEAAKERIEESKAAFGELATQLHDLMKNDPTLQSRFTTNPIATLESMKQDYPQLAQLTTSQMQYLAKSEYVSRELAPLLKTDPQQFVDKACERASQIDKVASKNGMFVEVAFCEQWTDKPIVQGGALMHPKVADTIVKQAEMQIRGLKAQAENNGDYFPYSECALTVFQAEKGQISNAFKTRVDIGDGEQGSLTDHLKQFSSTKTLAVDFEKATREKGAKEKILFNEDSHGANEQQVAAESEKPSDLRMSREEWAQEIGKVKESAQEQGSKQQTQEQTANRNTKNDKEH